MRFEGLTLTVDDARRSIDYYGRMLGLAVEVNAAPAFAMMRAPGGGTIGLLAMAEARKDGVEPSTPAQKRANELPHDAPWERSMTALDPDGYAVELAQGRRGHSRT
jgi:catechol 2,3-dioxygenase-like lactoylglutathione lyase family enzyme